MGRLNFKFNRRDFFKVAGAAGAGGLALGSGLTVGKADAAPLMPQRAFGKSGIKVPILSLGTMWDTINNQIVLKQALALGITYWDTAAEYHGGQAETGLGKFFQRNPGAREKVFLVTKASYARSTQDMTRLLNQSLEKMQTSYVDLYFVHGIKSVDQIWADSGRWAEQAKAKGLIKLFGFSTHRNMEDCLLRGAGLGYIDGVMMTYNHRIMHTDDMKRAVEACVKAGIGLTAMKTQGGGPIRAGGEAEEQLAERFLSKGYTPEQAKLKAVWTESNIASLCSQMPNLTILRANAAAALDRTQLSAADIRALDNYAQATAGCYCAGCSGICENALSGAAPVAEVMRCLMYHESHGDARLARELFNGLPREERLRLGSLDYSPAEEACPQGLAIGSLMRRAARVLA